MIAGFIVDFYCHKADLVIELDGSVHEEKTQKENDVMRDKALSELGLQVVRVSNKDVLKNLKQVIERIQELI